MNKPSIQFLYFDGCPLAPRARENLLRAIDLLRSSTLICLEEVDLLDSATPAELKRWGSPTILVDGWDLTGAQPGAACSCRIYAGEEGVPTTLDIIDAIDRGGPV